MHDAYEQALRYDDEDQWQEEKKSNRSIYPGVLFILVL